MNIMYINNVVIPDARANQASGIGRVTGQISEYLASQFHDTIYAGYFFDSPEKGAPHLSDHIQLALPNSQSNDDQPFEQFLDDHSIDIIQVNVSDDQLVHYIPTICNIAHRHNVKVFYCIHFMPGYEGVSFGSPNEVWYCFTHKKPFLNKLKKWLISFNRPLSTKVIWHLLKAKYKNVYDSCDKIVVFSDPYVDQYLHIVKGNRRDQFAVIPNPLTFNEFLPVDNMVSKKKEVLMVGRMQESQKRVSLALKIWKKIEQNPLLGDWTLTLVGNGQDEEYLHWQAEKYQLKRVRFEGRQDPKPYYERSAIFISTAGYEGWPMVLMEAMPMGCCCLSFDSYDAIHDIIKDGYNGRIIPNNDIKGYAKRLAELMLDHDKRTEIGIHAIESSHQFAMDKIGTQWHKLFEDLVATPNSKDSITD